MMGTRTLLVLAFSADLWAALAIVMLIRSPSTWDVPVAVSGANQPQSLQVAEPIQLWMQNGQIGFWPDRNRPMSLSNVCRQLSRISKNSTRRIEVRLLCDQRLTMREWAPVVQRISKIAEEVRLAPLPTVASSEKTRPTE